MRGHEHIFLIVVKIDIDTPYANQLAQSCGA